MCSSLKNISKVSQSNAKVKKEHSKDNTQEQETNWETKINKIITYQVRKDVVYTLWNMNDMTTKKKRILIL